MKRLEEQDVADLSARVIESGSWRLPGFFQREFEVLKLAIGALLALMILEFAQWPMLLVIIITAIPELLTERSYGRIIYGIHGAEAQVKRRYYDLRSHFLPSSEPR